MMTKKLITLGIMQAILALVAAVLFSNMSFVGRVGIRFVYKQYQFLKDPIKTSILLFTIQIVVLALLYLVWYFMSKRTSIVCCIIAIAIGIVGSVYTYYDFNMTSHKHMKLYFHLGGYTFWLGWFISCFTILFSQARNKKTINLDELEETQYTNLEN